MQVLALHYHIPFKQPDTLSETSADSADTLDCPSHQASFHQPCNLQTNNAKAKSSLCKNFTEKGNCPYGSKCQFAHGPAELKCNSDSQMSYKTRPCHSFLRKGYCCYGDRCNFLHVREENEMRQTALENYRVILYLTRGGNESRLLQLQRNSK